jgi:hypothetical protein
MRNDGVDVYYKHPDDNLMDEATLTPIHRQAMLHAH